MTWAFSNSQGTVKFAACRGTSWDSSERPLHMTAQPRREFGQVDRLPSGRYRARFTGPNGRRISAPHTFTTRREAAEFLAKTRGELLAGNTAAVIPCTMTLAEYLTQYLHTERERLRPRALDLYRRTAHHYILNPVGLEGTPLTLGTYQLSQLTPHLIRTWHTAVLETARDRTMQRRASSLAARQHPARLWAQTEGLAVKSTGRLSPEVLHAWQAAGAPTPAPPLEDPHAGRTVASQAYTLVRAVLNRAFEDGLIPANPARIRGASTAPHHERLPLTPAQVHALANAVPHRYRAAVLLAAWAGLRPGELFALRPPRPQPPREHRHRHPHPHRNLRKTPHVRPTQNPGKPTHHNPARHRHHSPPRTPQHLPHTTPRPPLHHTQRHTPHRPQTRTNPQRPTRNNRPPRYDLAPPTPHRRHPRRPSWRHHRRTPTPHRPLHHTRRRHLPTRKPQPRPMDSPTTQHTRHTTHTHTQTTTPRALAPTKSQLANRLPFTAATPSTRERGGTLLPSFHVHGTDRIDTKNRRNCRGTSWG